MKKFMVLFFLFGVSGFAAQPLMAPDFSVTSAATTRGALIRCVPPAGHHFNIQAPNKLVLGKGESALKIKPETADKGLVQFLVPWEKRGNAVNAATILYLCDDRNTFCESHEVLVGLPPRGQEQTLKNVAPRGVQSAQDLKDVKTVVVKKPTLSGFILNNASQAFKEAKPGNKPLLIEFFTIWCPACNMLEKQVFSTRRFIEEASGFVKLRMDSDRESSWELKSRFKVAGYPTVIFVTSDGEEIFRVVGYTQDELFFKELNFISKNPVPAEKLKAAAEKGDSEAIKRMGFFYLQRREFEEAARYLSRLPHLRLKWHESQISQFEDKNEARWIQSLNQAIIEFPDAPESLEYRLKLAEVQKGNKAASDAHLNRVVKTGKSLVDSPESLKGSDYQVQDVLGMIAEAHEKLGENELARAAYARAAESYKKVAGAEKERGPSLEFAYYSWKAGQFEVAERVYRQMESTYSREFTYFYQHATMEIERRNFADAQALARDALRFSYGDNRLRSAKLLARALQSDGKIKEALKVTQKVLDEFSRSGKLPSDPTLRTHRYFKSLQEVAEQLKNEQSRRPQ